MEKLKLLIPKGRIYEGIVRLMDDAGIRIKLNDRTYRPSVSDDEIEIKVMKPQNIPKIIEIGSHDAGFTGHDWVMETESDVVEVMDLGLDKVRIIAAIPNHIGSEELSQRKIVVASEYVNIATGYLKRRGFQHVLIRTHGATEVFPPDDADMIIDNASTGKTLLENNLKIVDTILESSTCFIAGKAALKDPVKHEKIMQLKMLFQSVLDARERVILEMNVPLDQFQDIIAILPCMRSPTVSPLHGEQGFAVKTAVPKSDVSKLIPLLKKKGATDILEYELRKVIP
ncbi:MAG: ATP phosphoribosyltransferase [Candidatus Delongbacteria bacterium]|nr:ATP phosphoribosyltransferase [Candidatus Delongbacteria bacterium]